MDKKAERPKYSKKQKERLLEEMAPINPLKPKKKHFKPKKFREEHLPDMGKASNQNNQFKKKSPRSRHHYPRPQKSSIIDKESLYSQFMSKDQQARFMKILNSPELFELDTEIARLKTLASSLDTSNLSEKNVKLLLSTHDLVARLISTRQKIHSENKQGINVKNINIIVKRIIQIIEKRVINPSVRQEIARDFKNLKIDF